MQNIAIGSFGMLLQSVIQYPHLFISPSFAMLLCFISLPIHHFHIGILSTTTGLVCINHGLAETEVHNLRLHAHADVSSSFIFRYS